MIWWYSCMCTNYFCMMNQKNIVVDLCARRHLGMCVCVHVCMCACLHARVHVCVCVCVSVCKHLCLAGDSDGLGWGPNRPHTEA